MGVTARHYGGESPSQGGSLVPAPQSPESSRGSNSDSEGRSEEKGDRLEELVTSEKTASRPQEGTGTGTHSIPSALTPAPHAAAQIHQGREEVTVLAQQ